jgi:hypothetical protein
MAEHLARLCIDGAGSTVHYRPHALDLHLLGTRQAADHMLEYARPLLGPALSIENSAFAAIRDPARVVITHVLATESFTSFDALGSSHA